MPATLTALHLYSVLESGAQADIGCQVNAVLVLPRAPTQDTGAGGSHTPAQDLTGPKGASVGTWAHGAELWGLGLFQSHGEAIGLQLEPQTCQVLARALPRSQLLLISCTSHDLWMNGIKQGHWLQGTSARHAGEGMDF